MKIILGLYYDGAEMYIEDELHPYKVVLANKDMDNKLEMWKWCVEQWGRPRHNKPINWNTDNTEYGYVFKFSNEKDRTFFILRWS
jgi:hypothetical protein